MPVKSFDQLIVWQKAMDLVESIYKVSSSFPREEVYGLTSQIRRASISIPSNIAEGQCRRSTRDFVRFLSVARGSLGEVHTQILLAERLGYLGDTARSELIEASDQIGRLISGLQRSLANRNRPSFPGDE
jgi:four helix bundle protein